MKGKILTAVGAAVAILTYGCAHPAVPVILPNGATGSVINCRLKAECFRLASRACGGVYYVIQDNDQPARDFTSSQGNSEYVIMCKDPQPEAISK